MRLQGQITVDVVAHDFVEAADHQRRLEDLLRQVREHYPEATLQVRERRSRTAPVRRPEMLEGAPVLTMVPGLKRAL